METYLVGGAVRDELLGLPVAERDYVVVGGTPAELEALGFKAVGRDFPVFLHPETGEEYALARTERKVGPGHQGFVCHASPEVTLEEDLRRRDLSINAIAKDADGRLVDPYGGVADLKGRRLRHVSAAFEEDPLRVLRLARFRARFRHLGFEVDAGTRELAARMVAAGLLEELPAERLLAELQKALATESPADFFRFLLEVGAHARLWPEIAPEAIAGPAQGRLLKSADARLACLLKDSSPEEVRGFCRRLKCSRKTTRLLAMVGRHWLVWRRLRSASPEEAQALFRGTDAYRQKEGFQRFNSVCGQLLDVEEPGKGAALANVWRALLAVAAAVRAEDVGKGAKGLSLGVAIEAERLSRIETYLVHSLADPA